MERWISISIVSAVSFLIYWNSLDNGLVFDDHRAILTNNDLSTKDTSLFDLFQHDFWGGTMWRKESHKSYRPLTVLTYRYLNHYFTGLEPYGYHLVNVLFHCIACCLFLLVAEVVLQSRSEWPLLATLLFTTHSIHVESVASVVGRAELLSAIFYFLAFLVYTKAADQADMSRTSWLRVGVTIALAICSMLSKEPGITVLGVCAGYDILKHWPQIFSFEKTYERVHDSWPVRHVNKTPASWKTWRIRENIVPVTRLMERVARIPYMSIIGLLMVSGIVLMWFRLSMNYGSGPIFKPEEMRAAFHSDRLVRMLSFSNIYCWNIWLLLAPSPLCCDWSLGTVPLITGIFDIRNVYSLLLYCALGIFMGIVLHKAPNICASESQIHQDRVSIGVSLALLIIPFVPSSGIVFRVGFVIAERVLFLSSGGVCLLVVIGARKIANFCVNSKKFVQCCLLFVVIVMSVKTISRNPDWKSDLSIFESGVKVNPKNVKMLNNYGMELKSANRLEESRKQYLRAIEIEPDYAEIYFNYGNLLSEMGDYQGAAENFEKAISYPQMYSKTLNNLATTYFRLGRLKDAEEKFLDSLKLNPDQPMTYNNLASLYGESKRFKESEGMFKKTIAMDPTYTEAYFNLGTLLYKMGKVDEAEKNLRHALKLNPSHHGAINNLKVIQYHRDKKQQ